MRFFLKNSAEVTTAAQELTQQEFLEKYNHTSSPPEYIIAAYHEIRALKGKTKAFKSVTFKVVRTDEKVVSITNRKSKSH